jgi:hypothetical protein
LFLALKFGSQKFHTKKGNLKTTRSIAGFAVISLIMAAGIWAGAVTSAFAYTGADGTLSFGPSTFQNGNGGEFNAVTTGLGTFPTFCIEDLENIGNPPSGPYTYTINTGAVQGGGLSNGANAIDPNTLLPMDNVSIGTAWLFSQFAAGTLTLDTGLGTYFDANRLANAGELQQAIWFLENEVNGVNNNYVSLAETALGNLTLAQVQADSGGAYGVVALNLFDSGGNLAQDQLAVYVVPEPTTAGCFLLGMGALVCSWRLRQDKNSGQATAQTPIRSNRGFKH